LFCSSPFATAHTLYAIRIRIVGVVTKERLWVTYAYLPVFKQLSESAADECAKLRRSAVL